jgi:hypothetical protein
MRNLPLRHTWLDGHKTIVQPNDIYLTTNGYDYKTGAFKKATWYAESYTYLTGEYNNYGNDSKWDHRFHFHPKYYSQPKSSYLQIHIWWESEKKLFDEVVKNKQVTHTFGMVLSKKPDTPAHGGDIGYMRSRAVNALKNRSFFYYGCNWPGGDPNYKGEVYVNGHKRTPQKFNDARILLSKCKFSICFENLHDENGYSLNYMTEKMFHGLVSGTIPIYCGCWNIHDHVDENLFIDLRKFKNGNEYDLNACFDFCEKMPESEYNGYLERIGKYLDTKGKNYSCESRFMSIDKKLLELFG